MRVQLGFLYLWYSLLIVESRYTKGCPLALASYYVWDEANITFIANVLNASTKDALSYNPEVPDEYRLQSFTRVNIPISCNCINGQFLGHVFQYQVQKGDTYDIVANTYYANLTTASWIQKFNSFSPKNIPENAIVNVPVNCSCGDASVSNKYGLFLTYPLRPEENISYIVEQTNSSVILLQRYNPNANFSSGTGLVYIPAKDKTGHYPSLKSSAGHFSGVIAGISVAAAVGLAILAVMYYVQIRRKKVKALLLDKPGDDSTQTAFGTIDKSVVFSFGELAQATNNFSMANKIGEGGFGAVYFAELRGEKAAVKKMDIQSSKQFLAELKVLTHVHHLNLVRLIGYCVEESLFLVYEFVENGNLSEHLRGSGREPLPWSTRVKIALDSARGLEYIHEHTVPVYIHSDIKSANILIDKSFNAKVADFGLTKLADAGNASAPGHFMGTFGYMPPEYAGFNELTPKVDVFAFGVVLYELISAKQAVINENPSFDYPKTLVGLFQGVLNRPDPNEIRELVDPRLGNNYPLDSVLKMARLANACTQEDPQRRPIMRSVVVALMRLSSASDAWDIDAF